MKKPMTLLGTLVCLLFSTVCFATGENDLVPLPPEYQEKVKSWTPPQLFQNLERSGFQVYPLHIAVLQSDTEKVQSLIAAGADPKKAIPIGNIQPLHWAARLGSAKLVKILIDAGASVNALTANGSTPLHFAVQTKEKEVVQLLMDACADLLVRNQFNYLAFHLAVKFADPDVIEWFLERQPSLLHETVDFIGFSNSEAIHIAAQENRLDLIPLLYQRGASLNAKAPYNGNLYNTPLTFAVMKGHLDMVKTLIGMGVSVSEDADNSNLIWVAMKFSHMSVIHYLLENYPDLCTETSSKAFFKKVLHDEDTPLMPQTLFFAFGRDLSRSVPLHPGNFNQEEAFLRTPLMAPIFNAADRSVNWLSLIPADILSNAQPKDLEMLLIYSVGQAQNELVQHLLRKGVSPYYALRHLRIVMATHPQPAKYRQVFDLLVQRIRHLQRAPGITAYVNQRNHVPESFFELLPKELKSETLRLWDSISPELRF